MPSKKQSTFIISGKGMVIAVSVILIALVWMFVLGVWVGRGTTPLGFKFTSLRQELEQLVQADDDNEDSFETGSDIGEKNEDLEFYDSLKRSQPGAEVRRIPIQDPGGTSTEKGTNGVELKKRSVPMKKPARIKPVATGNEATVNSEKPSADKPYTIQVASTKKKAAADQMIKEFKAMGLPAYHIKADIEGKGIWYRIRVGAFKSKNEASPMVKRLKKLNYNPMVIKQ